MNAQRMVGDFSGKVGNPPPDPHDGHRLANLVSRRHGIGYRFCLDCDVLLDRLRLCGWPTKRGTPCRTPIREDLGYSTCWSHGEGRGRTNTPRPLPAPGGGG
jgi:hypothetical protein